MNRIIKAFVLILFFSFSVQAQLSDLANVNYTFIPTVNSDIELTRIRALFNYPIKLKKEGHFLLVGLDYSNIHLRFKNSDVPFDRRQLDDFKLLDLNIGFTKPLKNNWRLGVRLKPGFSTNLATSSLSIEDVVLSADLVFIKQRELEEGKKDRLILGVTYSGKSGFNFPLPFISYYRMFHSKWSYNVGIPKTNLQYHASKKHRLKLHAELDGFTSNLQQRVKITDLENAESINMSLIIGGLQYEYHITKHLQFHIKTSYIFSNSNKLRNINRDNIITVDNSSTIYLKSGLRFKL